MPTKRKKKTVSSLARLTPRDVSAIRRMLKNGFSQVSLAKRYEVSQPTISHIAHGVCYKGIE